MRIPIYHPRAMKLANHTRIILVPILLACAGASCDSGTRAPASAEGTAPAPAAQDAIESLPQVDTSELASAELKIWVDLINEQLSPCGDPVSVGRCVAEKRGCGACVTAARYITRLVMEGHDPGTIREHYSGRFGKEPETLPDVANAPVRGAPMAPVTIVEFSDFQCPHCGRAHPELTKILATFADKVKLVFKHYPLAGHPRGMPAALAAEAARRQGKFWEMHDLLFEHQSQLEDADLMRYAEQLGLDLDQFREDLASSEVRERVEASKQEGSKLGVNSTPSIFVNGRRFQESLSNLPDYIREELDL